MIFRQTDLLIGGMDHDKHVDGILDRSMSYIQDDQTWCVHAARVSDTWQNIFSLFALEMWITVTLFAVLLAIILHLLMKFCGESIFRKDFSYTLLVAFASFLNISPSFKPHGAAVKILFIFASAYGIIFSAIFSCSLISVLTRPRAGFQVNSISSAYHEGYRFASGNVAQSHIVASKDEVTRQWNK